MPPKQLSSPTSLDLEYKYRVALFGEDVLLPFTLAKKHTTYPDLCIFEHDEPVPAIVRTHLCWRCTEWLRESLTTIAQRWPDLEDALAPAGGRAASSERVSGTGDLFPPLPINGEVSDLMRDARNSIWSTVGQLVQDRPDLRMPADHGTGILADWLARWHVDYLASHPSAAHLVSVSVELARIAPRIQTVIFAPTGAELGTDVTCHQPSCRGQVVAILMPDGRKVVRCSEDITHRVAADQWFYTHANSRPGRARNALKKKYMKARQA